jgi:hypothetical protein
LVEPAPRLHRGGVLWLGWSRSGTVDNKSGDAPARRSRLKVIGRPVTFTVAKTVTAPSPSSPVPRH